MDQERPRPPAARWMQPNPRPFWGSKLFLLNLIACSLIVMIAAGWIYFVEPARRARDRAERLQGLAAKKYVPSTTKEVRFDGMLDRVEDDVDHEKRDDDAYRYLAKYMATVDPARLGEQARLAEYETFMEKPGEMRGVTARLNLLFYKKPYGLVRLDRPAGSVETVTRGYFTESVGKMKQVYFVDFVEPLEDIESEAEVVLDAVFLRRVKFEVPKTALNPEGWHQAPLFLARSVAKVQDPPKPLTQKYLPLALILGVGVLAFLSLITIKTWMASRSAPPPARRSPG
jgi:hypothetical protein